MMRMRTTNNTDEFELLNNVKTHVLKVHINCQGCVKKVRKQLLKIQGVYSVNIDKKKRRSQCSEGHNDHLRHQLSVFEDYVSSGGGGAVAVPMPLYEYAGQYSRLPVLPADYQF
ncbi:hypothetical protein M0R45_006615 [Rubus argutus]|uniref:HMA domain-containing protein n=1 Tax=Rubus argutus TaxID=59490 RepID=A0AAW1YQY7_RUBAR